MKLKRKIVFLSGAITGVDGYKQIFADAEQRLLEQDCTVLNPAVLPPSGLEWEARTCALQRRCCARRRSSMCSKIGSTAEE